jgi:hypothetical protein
MENDQLKDFTFKTDLALGDVLVDVDGVYYIIAAGESKEYPFKVSEIISHRTKRRLQTLENQVTKRGHMLSVGWLRKIINAQDYELHIVPKQPFD